MLLSGNAITSPLIEMLGWRERPTLTGDGVVENNMNILNLNEHTTLDRGERPKRSHVASQVNWDTRFFMVWLGYFV